MKNKNNIFIGIGVLVIGLLGGYLITQDGSYASIRDKIGFKHQDQAHKMHDANEQGMSEDKKDTVIKGISERAFLEHMIPHHQEAVNTANEVLARGENAEVKTLAKSIIAAQEKEISDMKGWYMKWYGTEYKDNGEYKPMMRDLSNLSGNTLDKAFIEDMITHHMHALMTNQQVVPNIEHAEIKALANAIAETQSSEIVTMRILMPQL